MANDDQINARGGLLPVDWPFGSYKVKYYRLTTGNASANVFIGMPVDLDANGRAAFTAAGTGNPLILGPVLGFLDTNMAAPPAAMTTLTQGAYLPGNTDAYVMVCDDPNQEFMIQEDTGGSALVEGNIGNNIGWQFRSTSGSTTTGYAFVELQRATASTSTGGPLLLSGLATYKNSDGSDNAPGNYCKWKVRIASHRYAAKPNAQAI